MIFKKFDLFSSLHLKNEILLSIFVAGTNELEERHKTTDIISWCKYDSITLLRRLQKLGNNDSW